MTSTDAFALKNSDLNRFLFAEVGTELNGSALTILSILARLGLDPWAEAARWAKMPKAAAINCLAQGIGKMPLSPEALAETLATASSLVKLLPAQKQAIEQGSNGSEVRTLTALEWMPMAVLCLYLIFGVMINLISNPVSTAAAPTAQTTGVKSHTDPVVAAKSNVLKSFGAGS
jgi:hypothetical protein